MSKGRLEAFSDGVLAIIITIMVLEIKVPHGSELSDLASITPVLLAYLLSFVYIGIYWNNHHHLLQAARNVNGSILWANLHLLFWLSLVPFVTHWMGENPSAPVPAALYGVVMLMAAFAYTLLTRALTAHHGADSVLARALGADVKGKASLLLYAASVPAAFAGAWIAYAVYVVVAVMWIVPDSRFERELRG